jgi:hypothetical protein
MIPKGRLAGLLLVASTLLACHNDSVLTRSCVSDSDCLTHFRCGTSGEFIGKCVCADDLACPGDAGPEFCNQLGICQPRVGCFSNVDCASTEICNTRSNLCIPVGGCGSDVDCPFGQYCPATHECTPGCHSSSDCGMNPQIPGNGIACLCPNGQECSCPPDAGSGIPDPNYDRLLCPVGVCNPDTCAGDVNLCNTGQSCFPSTVDGGLSTCEPDPRLNILCQPCGGTFKPGQVNPCDVSGGSVGANFCLLDPYSNGTAANCGVDCSLGQGCPSGYDCNDVLILTGSICGSDFACVPPGAQTCTTTAECPADTQCTIQGGQGHCGGFCTGAEGASSGFCTCVQDSDCPVDTCDSTGRCRITLQPCIPGDPSACGALRCVDVQGTKLCLIGRNCYPTHGYRCPPPSRQ